jgi:hypothetical protein
MKPSVGCFSPGFSLGRGGLGFAIPFIVKVLNSTIIAISIMYFTFLVAQ